MNFPAAHFHDDTAGSQLIYKGGVLVTVAQPALDGTEPGPVWDWQAHRWIPAANPRFVSPDGSKYVYMQANGSGGPLTPTRLRVVNVATGSDQLLPSGGYDEPLLWAKEGIYVVSWRFEASTSGLRLLDPVTGAQRVIAQSGGWYAVSGVAAWGFAGTAYTNDDFPDLPRSLDRLDLATGRVTNWYSVSARHNVHIAAVDLSGRPIIVVDEYHVFRLAGPDRAQPLFDSPVPIWDRSRPQIDSHGFWFVGDWYSSPDPGAVWLYSASAGLRKVAETGRYLSDVEGPCR